MGSTCRVGGTGPTAPGSGRRTRRPAASQSISQPASQSMCVCQVNTQQIYCVCYSRHHHHRHHGPCPCDNIIKRLTFAGSRLFVK